MDPTDLPFLALPVELHEYKKRKKERKKERKKKKHTHYEFPNVY
jgi:hypothetical protein